LPKVFLVDANDVNRALAKRQLERLGVPCHAVSSGAEAIDALRRARYALALMDCRMPEMGGLEATRRIRQREAEIGLHTPIIALSADSRPQDRTACLAAGMDDHVAGPLTIDDLDRVLAPWLPVVEEAADPPMPAHEARADSEPWIRTLLEQIGQDETARLCATWKTETARRLEAMRIGLDRRDPGAVADAAHVLKSTCGPFGAREPAMTAAVAQDAAHNGNPSELLALYQRLEREVTRAIADLELQLSAWGLPGPATRPLGGLGLMPERGAEAAPGMLPSRRWRCPRYRSAGP